MSEEKKTPEAGFDLESFAKEVAEKTATTIAMKQAEAKAAEEKASTEAAEKQAEVEVQEKAVQEAKQEEQKSVIQAGLTGAERLIEDVEKRVNEKQEDLGKVVKELEAQLVEKSSEIMSIRESKRHFGDRTGGGDWREEFKEDLIDAKFAGLATGKGWNNDHAKSLMQKVNVMSGVEV